MSSNNSSHDADHLDFSKLEKEVQNAVVNEERYWRENDAKIRAVEQRVPTYDDFREMVLAAHLKPLEKKDKISSIGRFTQVWNQSAHKHPESSPETKKPAASPEQEKDNVAKPPKSSKEFTLHWVHHCKTLEEKKQYLFKVGARALIGIFRVEITGTFLGEFLECLQSIEDSEATQTVEILEALTKSQRFSLSLAFLNKQEQMLCKLLFEKLKVLHSINDSPAAMEKVTELGHIYCLEDK